MDTLEECLCECPEGCTGAQCDNCKYLLSTMKVPKSIYMYNTFSQNQSIQTLASKLKYNFCLKIMYCEIMITVPSCRLDVEDLCDQCVNSIDCDRTCSDFTCICDFNYNSTLCDQSMHTTFITNALGCLQVFSQETSAAEKYVGKLYVLLNWTLKLFNFTVFLFGGRQVKLEKYVPCCSGNLWTILLCWPSS